MYTVFVRLKPNFLKKIVYVWARIFPSNLYSYTTNSIFNWYAEAKLVASSLMKQIKSIWQRMLLLDTPGVIYRIIKIGVQRRLFANITRCIMTRRCVSVENKIYISHHNKPISVHPEALE